MQSLNIVACAAMGALLLGCASGPVVQDNTKQFPSQNLKWWITGRVLPDVKPTRIHITFQGVPQLSAHLSEAFAKAGYQITDAASAQQDLLIQGLYESHGQQDAKLALGDMGWGQHRDVAKDREIAKDAAISTSLSAAAVDASLMGQWWGVGAVANAVMHSTGLASRFNNWVTGTGRRYKSGWSDQTIRLDVQDLNNVRQRTVIMSGVSSRSMWPDQLLDEALRELMRQYEVVDQSPPSSVLGDLTALEDAMSATEVE